MFPVPAMLHNALRGIGTHTVSRSPTLLFRRGAYDGRATITGTRTD
jgi:hypothetical protein